MSEFKQVGGCQCGAVRFTLKKQPEVIYCCHCTECQKQSSSAFGISVRVDKAALEIVGECKTFSRPSANGNLLCDFCPTCGNRLFHRREAYSDQLNTKGGSYDDTSWIKPAGHIWTKSKQPWVTIPKDDLCYERQPENYDTLTALYRQD